MAPLMTLCTVLAAAGLLATQQVDAARPAPVVDETKARSLYVTVRDDDALVTGLSERNFEVRVAGEPREFVLRDPEPAQIAILVEYSPTSLAYMEDIFSAMSGVVGNASAGHWYALAVYSDELIIVQDFTKRLGLIAQAFTGLPRPRRDSFMDSLRTFDAVYEMVQTMSSMAGRQVLIVIGSGFDSLSRRTTKDILESLEPSGVTVFGLGTLPWARESFITTDLALATSRARRLFTRLADRSGGFARFPLGSDEYYGEGRNIFAALDAQYELVYVPRSAPHGESEDVEVLAFHETDLQVKHFSVVTRVARSPRTESES
ncbi:MAG: hypothetical protein V3S54_06510 [Woeseiaceae bacterium]